MKKRGPPSSVGKYLQSSGQGNSEAIRYHWMCYAGAQKEGQSCSFYQVLDMEAEGRGVKQGVSYTVSCIFNDPNWSDPAYSILTGDSCS